MESSQIVVRSLNFDRTLRRSWRCELVGRTDEMLTLIGVFDREIDHPHLGLIECGTRSTEFFWFDRWYNVFRFDKPKGEFRNFYCNVNLPPTLTGGILEYVDLDIDVVVWPDGSHEVLDRDEFEQNSEAYEYPIETIARVETTLDHLTSAIKACDFPFTI